MSFSGALAVNANRKKQSFLCQISVLLSYHRCLRMISEALEFCMESGRVSHGWCMVVVSHGYGGLGGSRVGGGG